MSEQIIAERQILEALRIQGLSNEELVREAHEQKIDWHPLVEEMMCRLDPATAKIEDSQ